VKFEILTTQPGIYESFLKTGLIARGISKDIINISIHSLYDYADDPHHSIDDTPYGGGAGMIIRVDIIDQALFALNSQASKLNAKIILLTPQGKLFNQEKAIELSKEKNLIIISGRFEGYDERIRDLVDEEISVGDYVLTSGDLPAMILIDSVSRQIPGFIEKEKSIEIESFSGNSLEYPQYTRPEEYKGKFVPEILLSGNHGEVDKWRKKESEKRTKERRPDLSAIAQNKRLP